jgi:hypothetical protein
MLEPSSTLSTRWYFRIWVNSIQLVEQALYRFTLAEPRDNQNVEAPTSKNKFRLWQLFLLLLILIITQNTDQLFVILEKQMSL